MNSPCTTRLPMSVSFIKSIIANMNNIITINFERNQKYFVFPKNDINDLIFLLLLGWLYKISCVSTKIAKGDRFENSNYEDEEIKHPFNFFPTNKNLEPLEI